MVKAKKKNKILIAVIADRRKVENIDSGAVNVDDISKKDKKN